MSKEGGKGSGGTNPNPGGSGDPNNPTPSGDPPKEGMVSYESMQKALDEKKRAQEENQQLKERVAAFEKAEKEKERKALEEKGEYEKALALANEELEKEKSKLQSLNSQLTDGKKLKAFLSAVGGDVDEKFWGLIDLDRIKVSDTGEIDKNSLTEYATKFSQQYGNEIIRKGGTQDLPPNPPPPGAAPAGQKITYQEWLALPLKEKKARMKDVDKATMNQN